MQPSQLEIQREVEALRDIKRRSTAQGGPGALILDPDLPNPSSPPSPTSSYWTATAPQQLPDGDSSSSSHEGSSSSEERSVGLDDPFHLFWVPARFHPEIDPGQFSAFLKEHARTPPPDGGSGPLRSNSLSIPSTGLGRKRSMLSRQYKPSENDQVEDEDEKIVPSRPNRTPLANAPQLTISDLQRLETLAEEASKSDDPTKLRNVLRRSLSLNVSPSAMDRMDDIPDMPDEVDAPIIVPPPGLILRRAARTKIRKTTLPGDGGGHRFGSGRRPRAAAQGEPRTSSDLSSSDHVSSSDHGDITETGRRPRALSNESITSDGHTSQTDVLIDETLILEAYLCDVPDGEAPSILSLNSDPPLLSFSPARDEPPPTQTEPSPDTPTNAIVLHHPQPQRLTLTSPSEESSRTPSPDTSTLASTEAISTSSLPQKTPSPVPKKEKDRKGLFKWGSDKGGKKNGKDREREKEVQRVEKEKESGFFGSLFSSKKKGDEQASQPHPYGSGREAATALLGQSKSSKQYVPSPSPQLPGGQGVYARYPIHVERAIYRLSHIKLANPRRPLYEQVLISNLMFWYLGVINKTQNPAATPVAQNQPAATALTASNPENEQVDRESERREAEERQRVENERLEREREIERERELQLQQQQPQKKESQRRGALTKPSSGSQGARRVAEMPIKGPQYEMQHREMEQQYNGSSYGYGSSSPTPLGGGPPRMQRQSNPPVHTPQIVQPQSTNYMYPGYSGSGAADQQQFPLDTMQPTESWTSPSTPGTPPLSRTRLTPSPPPNHAPSNTSQQAPARRSRSPPAQNHNKYSANASPAATNRVQATRATTRSLSATATTGATPALPAEAKTRKVASAHAVMSTPHNRRPRAHAEPALPLRTERGEEEDVPLAVWQQQRRK
ncbi:uncharacterized protein HD556DRAFT_1238998 [Suillus plorans]|uniref:Protein Zds1 C-terminal domain-containing protein n=1 Tax=Suillus plorans TaxID=116603 RepID=A0A9P7AMK7_9AGAM|nr:uncharacterized protein HD556DRAFT_1238998 [Suillus plorans]KAG1792566.1 hypothetical protein HD556DRAFT_1238998 [Suillus plorans]